MAIILDEASSDILDESLAVILDELTAGVGTHDIQDESGIDILDESGSVIFDEGALPTVLAILVASTITSRVSNISSFSSKINVGAIYQGNMRQLALDRWNYMYPS